jgi:hypothetical protein
LVLFPLVVVCNVYAADILKDLQQRDTDANTAQAIMPMDTLVEERGDSLLHTYVPPIAAPTQKNYIAPHIITTTRRCGFFPYCKLTAMECGGTRKICCKNYSHFKDLSDVDLRAAKRNVLNQERKNTRRAQRNNLTPYLSKKAHFGSGRWKNFKSGNHPFKLLFLTLDAPSSELPFDITRILVGLEMIDCRSIEAP